MVLECALHIFVLIINLLFRNEGAMVELDGMLSIVMPAYNEEKLIYQSIMKTLDIVSGFVREIELIAVND